MNIIKYKSPFGIITIQEKNNAISKIYLPNAEPNDCANDCVGAGFSRPLCCPNKILRPLCCPNKTLCPETDNNLLIEAKSQFTEYFNGKLKVFDLPLNFDGCTDFMKSVYLELLKINYGETVSYKYIAEKINCPKGFRAVGLANNKNPLPIIVPCHRVIGSNGNLVGYGGGIDLKIELLELERNNKT